MSHVDGMKSLHADNFEASHKRFKSLCANSSRRKRTARGKVASVQSAETIENIDSFINNRLENMAMDRSAEEAQDADSCTLARSGAKCTQLAVESETLEAETSRDVPVSAHEDRQIARNLFAASSIDGYRAWARLLRLCFTDCRENLNVARHKRICMQESAYVFSCQDPGLRDEKHIVFKEFLDDVWRVVQRDFSAA